jgi:hypothetical protein
MSEAPVYTPVPMTTMTTTNATTTEIPLRPARTDLRRATVVARRSSQPLWRTCADVVARTCAWVSRRRYELAPVGVTSTLTVLGLEQGGVGATAAYAVLAAGAGAATILGLRHKAEPVVRVGAGGFLALADIATASGAGASWPTATAFALSTGAAYAVYGPWLAEQRNKRMKLHVDTVKARGAVPQAMGLEAADPGLVGSTIQETALRRAIHALAGVTPLDVPAFTLTDGGGFTALVVMPPGKNTSPDSLIKRRVQLAANLGLDGTLHLARGDADNQLVVRLVATDILAGTIPYTDDGATSLADPVRLGLDEHGREVSIQILYRHTLVAGASDWGKSGLLNLIIKRLARRGDVDLYGIDMKPGSVELGPWEPLMKRVAKGAIEARELLEWIRGECDRRGKILADLSARALAEGREPVRKWVPGVHGNGIVVVTDELAELIRQDEELRRQEAEEARAARKAGVEVELHQPVSTQYESLLAIARFLAIQFVSATQQPSRKVFGGSTDARGNYANRLSTRTGEAGHGPFIFGQGSQTRGWRPEELDLPGKFLIATPELENAEPRICRAEYVTDADIAADVSGLYARAAAPAPVFTKPAPVPRPAPLHYPDGTAVEDWPDLYRVFAGMGAATKDELTAAGPYGSRDTVRRALDAWTAHGVQARREGRTTRYYLPEQS